MYEVILWDMIGLCAVCAVLGVTVGVYLCRWALRWRQEDAPVPDYDVNNPVNGGGRRGETVQICGHTFWRIN